METRTTGTQETLLRLAAQQDRAATIFALKNYCGMAESLHHSGTMPEQTVNVHFLAQDASDEEIERAMSIDESEEPVRFG